MKRTIYTEEHEAFRDTIRSFITRDVVPDFPDWEKAGHAPLSLYRKLGQLGVTGFDIPEEYGGVGKTSYRYHAIISEEVARAGVPFDNFTTAWGIVLPYLMNLGTEEQKKAWLPGVASGDSCSRSRCPNLAPGRTWPASERRPSATVTSTS